MKDSLLVAWIGRTDLKASSGALDVGPGPIAQALGADRYKAVHLLCDFSAEESDVFLNWIKPKTNSKVSMHPVKLSSPVDFGEIYERVVAVLREISDPATPLTFHLSPGTPTMAAVWILLAKTIYPARLIQASTRNGVEEANIPFDMSAEFIPQLLQRSDERLSALAMGTANKDAVFENIIYHSPVMERVIEHAQRVASRNISVLIEGESGTGKELMAHAIHGASSRKDKPFITVNCGAIPPELVESEFFGHMKGSFTGATANRNGHFKLADGGTIFLDEIGELSKSAQVKLLRTLQEGEITPVGSSIAVKVDVRIVAATNRTLIKEVVSGNFREDLFYRLAVAIIKLPPIRDRAGDLFPLIDALLKQVNAVSAPLGITPKKISDSAMTLLRQHPWPGNVRELLNTLQRAAVWSDDEKIGPEAISDAILNMPTWQTGSDECILNRPLDSTFVLENLIAEVAQHYLQRALEQTKNNKTQAAALLGFKNYQTLSNWMKRYNVGK